MKCASGFAKRRRSLTKLRSRKVDRANGVEVALFNYALHENGADYTALADKTNIFYKRFFLQRCVLYKCAGFFLAHLLLYKKQLKLQVKLINDSEAISNATYFALLARRKFAAIIREFEL